MLTQQISRADLKDRSFENAKSTGWYTHYAGRAAWDAKSVIQFSGKVIGLIESAKSVDLMVKVEGGGTAFVELGPKEYFDGQALHISSQDAVKISGSKVMVNGESLVLCQELRHKGSKIAFRTLTGKPFWLLK
jgi:hypothetical protein